MIDRRIPDKAVPSYRTSKKVFQIPLKTGHSRVWAILLVVLINVKNQFKDICTHSLRLNLFLAGGSGIFVSLANSQIRFVMFFFSERRQFFIAILSLISCLCFC